MSLLALSKSNTWHRINNKSDPAPSHSSHSLLVETVGKYSPAYLSSQVFICDQNNEDRESGHHFPQHCLGHAGITMLL